VSIDTVVQIVVGSALAGAVIWRVLYVARQWKDEPNPKERPTHVQLHRVITDDPTAEPNGPPDNAKVVQRFPNNQQDCSTVQLANADLIFQARLEAHALISAAARFRQVHQDIVPVIHFPQIDGLGRLETRN
jgi:hypothetical protein